MPDERQPKPIERPWDQREPGRLVGKGHPAGDFLEAHLWEVLHEGPGELRVRAHLPEHVRNLRGQLFGGFTPTYVDMIALFTTRAIGAGEPRRYGSWMATTNMRVDYFEPITGPTFTIESHVVKRRGRTNFIETRFFDGEGDELAVFAVTTLREVPDTSTLGDA